ncbi:MAG TPA: class I SAM-dependent methyltransferase, partial [Cyclobacteriaceae bacterium]|nr:class I SAM-dependent methyltransferase [Cyclobacteriaceae bacterium]
MKIQGRIVLKKGREASVKRFHPWIFSGAIFSKDDNLSDGDWVEVKDGWQNTLGAGHYQNGTIAVRVLSFADTLPSASLYVEKILAAYNQRLVSKVISNQTDSYRLVHGEGDGLPGLIIDIYNGVAVMQAHSVGMHRDREMIAQAISTALGSQITAVFHKNQAISSEKSQNAYLQGMSPVPHIIQEHGHKFYVDWEEGQKTGFFLDQRENRKLVGEMARGARVLNTFCYTGGFSVYALNGGAQQVHSVDASE